MRAERRHGFMIVLVLFMLILLLIAGMAYLGKRAQQYRGAASIAAGALARELAESGLEDARVKLQKDLQFPPAPSVDQTVYSYSENLYAQDGVTLVGVYSVTVDTTYSAPPYSILRLTSVGQTTQQPRATRKLAAELDIAPLDRGTGGPNAKLFLYRNFTDEGSL